MLCHSLNTGFCAADSKTDAVLAPATSSACFATRPDPLRRSSFHVSASTHTSSGTLRNLPCTSYSLSLPPPPSMPPQPLDTYSTPSSSTPCTLPSVRSWHHPNSHSNAMPLILDSLGANKVNMVENLVDTAALIIESIWPSPSMSAQLLPRTPVIPLHIFVKETLRRSRTTLSTLQLALYYVYRVRHLVLAAQQKIRQDQIQHYQQHMSALQQAHPPSPCDTVEGSPEVDLRQRDYFSRIQPSPADMAHAHPTPPGTNTPVSLSPLSSPTSTPPSPVLAKAGPATCGRRMFLAALILASKYQQDRTYSNKAWSKISGLPVSEINLNEIAFLSLIDYRLFVSQAVFQKWVLILTEKGRFRDQRSPLVRHASSPSLSDLKVDGCGSSACTPMRRNSIYSIGHHGQLPPRMTCVTASTLQDQPTAEITPSLPSFALFVGQPSQSQVALSQHSAHHGQAFQCGTAQPEPCLPKIQMNTGPIQAEFLPRQQEGMASLMTQRWVQAQRQEFLRSRAELQPLAYSTPELARPLPRRAMTGTSDADGYLGLGLAMDGYVGMNMGGPGPMWSKSMDALTVPQGRPTKVAELKSDCMPSPASSASPVSLQIAAGSKRRVSELDDSRESDRDLKTSRRLSVSFLVGF